MEWVVSGFILGEPEAVTLLNQPGVTAIGGLPQRLAEDELARWRDVIAQAISSTTDEAGPDAAAKARRGRQSRISVVSRFEMSALGEGIVAPPPQARAI